MLSTVSKLGLTISLSVVCLLRSRAKANFYVIQAYAVSVRRKKVKVFTDKENASRIFEIRAWEKSDQYGIRTHDLCDTSAALYQLSLQENWELVNKPSKWWIMAVNIWKS